MNIEWKYVEPVDGKFITRIEEHYKTKLPEDYKALLGVCNQGKPEKERFDIASRKECVLNYLVDLSDVIEISERIRKPGMIPVGLDPFGNIIGFRVSGTREVESLVFWDHETGLETNVAETFTEFLEMLY